MKSKVRSGKEYERVWGEVVSLVDHQIAEGCRDVNQIVAEVLEGPSQRFLSSRRFRRHFEDVGIRHGAGALPAERVAVRDGAYQVVPFRGSQNDMVVNNVVDFLADHREQVDCVVELGSGIGNNLFSVFHAARDRLGAELELHACELTETGRKVTETFHRLCPGMNLSIHPFDYYAPDLSFLQPDRNVLFFTVFSIEQITVLGRTLFDEMLGRSKNCFCLHFEPVGWQFDELLLDQRTLSDGPAKRIRSSLAKRLRKVGRPIDWTFRTRFDSGFPGIALEKADIGKPDRVSSNAAAWSARAGYNKNLVSLLDTLAGEARITIERKDLNVFGENPFNPGSVILWKKAAV